MRKIDCNAISEAVARLVIEANVFLPDDVLKALERGEREEESAVGKDIFRQIIKNNEIAASEGMPVCQDTGMAVIFVEIGNEVYIEGDLEKAINDGVRMGYRDGCLRKSIVNDPIKRVNTGDNTPAVIHYRFVRADHLKITVAPKGGGSENMSLVKMLKPADGKEGVRRLVLETVRAAGANPCPPIIVGIGLGGNFEKAALLAKEALLRPLDDRNPDPDIAAFEESLLEDINKLGIGPQGLGGRITALACKINTYPCHIASLPVGININCHVARHKSIEL
ncbi:MAG: fumarate hydratase [Halanaerobiaceae bacterium]|jgi:fumarate hydratase subunit alpha|nr:fumarate hydratase [Halanaerobiaceae bacterium]